MHKGFKDRNIFIGLKFLKMKLSKMKVVNCTKNALIYRSILTDNTASLLLE